MIAPFARTIVAALRAITLAGLVATATWAKDGGGSGGSGGSGSAGGGRSGGGGPGGQGSGAGPGGGPGASSASSHGPNGGGFGVSASAAHASIEPGVTGGMNGSLQGDDGGEGDPGGSREPAQDGWGRSGPNGLEHGAPSRDHDVARDAVSRGAAIPLSRILVAVRQFTDGDVLDVRLRRKGGVPVYDVTVLSRRGEYRSIVVDARSSLIIGSEQR